jgi:hypothetical protein
MLQTDPSSACLQAAIAVELRHIAALLNQLAEVLVGDEHFALHHIDQLQSFDLLVQYADENASVLDRLAQGADPHAAVARVRLTAIQDRLGAALAKAA